MSSPAAETPDRRLEHLEARVLRLEEALTRLSRGAASHPETEAREAELLTATADGTPAAASDEPLRAERDEDPLAAYVPKTTSIFAALSALGTSFLVLGGAFLIRTVTEAGVLPTVAGIAVGFVYALGVIASADRVARKGRRILAAFLLATAIGIAHPLVYEAVTRFHAIGPLAAAAALVLFAAACLAAARHRQLPALAWAECLAMAAASFALASATGAISPFAAALLAAGVAVEWTPGSSGWRSARWPAAAAADGMLLWLGVTSARSAAPDAGIVTLAILLALPILYVGGIAARTFATRREAGPFEVVQSFAALAIGLGGAAGAIHAAGGSLAPLGIAAMLAAICGYAVALGPLSRGPHPSGNASLAGALALALALFGSACVLSGQVLAGVWLGFTAAMALAALAGRPGLRPHVAAFAWAAAWQSGLLVEASAALLAPRGRGFSGITHPAALGTIAISWIVLGVAAARGRRRSPGGRASRVALAVVAGLGAAGLAVALASPIAAVPGGVGSRSIDSGTLALLRSAALAGLAIAYAASARRWALKEVGGLAYAVLVLWGGKLLIEDVPAGRPLTLFVAFALYGATLLTVPRLLRGRAEGAAGAAVADEHGSPPAPPVR